ncbi:MAG: hypothetical protein JNG90_08900 [Planctomycetaceae bacterium]|nr:hypothetical protein [Planctomycetaceae bacterium]
MALVAGAIEPDAILAVRRDPGFISMRQLIDESRAIEDYPELFPFGLLAEFDLPEIEQLGGQAALPRDGE